jgi:hypothetical protein
VPVEARFDNYKPTRIRKLPAGLVPVEARFDNYKPTRIRKLPAGLVPVEAGFGNYSRPPAQGRMGSLRLLDRV